MGRSQRHKVLTQGISSSEELYAEGVGFIPPETTYAHSGVSPVNSGPSRDIDPDAQKLPMTYGDPGGPLQGSIVQSAYSEGGTQPTPPDLEPEPEPEPPAEPPVITTITPVSATLPNSFIVTIDGTGFTPTTVANFGGIAMATMVVSDTQITMNVDTTGLIVGTYVVEVGNEAGISNAVDFDLGAAP